MVHIVNMSEEDRKIQKHLVDEMMKVSKTNPDVMVYMEALMKKYEELEQKVEQLEKENKILKESAEHNDKVVDKVNWENMLLKGKLKDLKERIMLKQLRLVNEETYNILHSDLNELLEVLDEEIKYEQ